MLFLGVIFKRFLKVLIIFAFVFDAYLVSIQVDEKTAGVEATQFRCDIYRHIVKYKRGHNSTVERPRSF